MKLKFKNLLSLMLVAATAKVSGNPIVNDSQNTNFTSNDNDNESTLVQKNQKLIQKYIIKKWDGDDYLIAGHRSHTSHRSHISHRSSSGGYYSAPSKKSTPSKSYSSPSSSSSSSNSSSSTTTYPSNATKEKTINYTSPRICNIGERIISSGACGTDVKVLASLLVKHGYLDESEIKTDDQGYACCDEKMTAAIIQFQKDAKLTADGYAGAATIKALKEWKKD